MNFDKLLHQRYSCRHYSPKEIDEELFNQVLESARLAPTAANRQPFQVIIIKTAGNEDDLARVYPREWFTQPPIILCVVCQPEEGWKRTKYDNESYAVVDAAIVMDHITLQAADIGLGTCWIGDFNPEEAREFLQLPSDVEPVAFTPLGYPLDEPKPKVRKELEDIIRYDKW